MGDPLKSLPTLDKVAERVALLHKMLSELAQAMGTEVAQLNATIKQNTDITDEVLREMGLQITFLMQTIRVSKPLHGGIAGADGKVPMEVKTASQIYQESGRDKLLAQIEAVKRAQGLPTAESPADAAEASAGASSAEDGAAVANAEAGFPKLITH